MRVTWSAALLIAAGDNPDRLRSEASFAALCGVSPIDASSSKRTRRRLNRGGDRQANTALYRIAQSRLRWDQRSRDYLVKCTREDMSRRETIRCLKRYIAPRFTVSCFPQPRLPQSAPALDNS